MRAERARADTDAARYEQLASERLVALSDRDRLRTTAQTAADHGRICNTVSIRERPADVEDRAVPGHWEGDLLFDSGNSQIATLVERSTRYEMLVKVDRKDTKTVVDALIERARQLPNQLYQSLPWDRGKELADHRRFTLATEIQAYSCDPQSPWQRGSNENTNGLRRQHFPKGIDVSGSTQAQLDEVARRLNERPRKTLNFETPIERYRQAVALTGCTAVESKLVTTRPGGALLQLGFARLDRQAFRYALPARSRVGQSSLQVVSAACVHCNDHRAVQRQLVVALSIPTQGFTSNGLQPSPDAMPGGR